MCSFAGKVFLGDSEYPVWHNVQRGTDKVTVEFHKQMTGVLWSLKTGGMTAAYTGLLQQPMSCCNGCCGTVYRQVLEVRGQHSSHVTDAQGPSLP